ncbi:DUF1961 family protein [uncultured Bacteroides sp.]|uniref:DUF1961 family protein n=1 Tax=uncultured Bacteroides sp. TaxID=162156 RepID=UPI0026232056|nr:DUF1961 family protein [uncultured Bacteroides sp.]
MRVFFLLIGLLLQIGAFAQSEKYYGEFQKLASKDMKLVFEDSFKKDWQKQWFKDGDIAKAVHRNGGLEVYAGDEAYNDAHHTVLWTKKEFEGNIMIEYDFTRLDSSKYYFVNILYIQATGSGEGEYAEDISKWNNLRKVPAMSTYFRNMNTYHISYAVTGVPSENKDEYIRGRRYMPGNNLNGTDLKPEYYNTGLFKIGVTYHIKVIKYGDQLYMNVTGDGKNETFYFDGSSAPAITKGRIGLRQMFTRNSRYANFKVYSIK